MCRPPPGFPHNTLHCSLLSLLNHLSSSNLQRWCWSCVFFHPFSTRSGSKSAFPAQNSSQFLLHQFGWTVSLWLRATSMVEWFSPHYTTCCSLATKPPFPNVNGKLSHAARPVLTQPMLWSLVRWRWHQLCTHYLGINHLKDAACPVPIVISHII